MAQPLATDFPVDPVTTSGTALADILNRLSDSVGTSNAGATPPPDTMPGMLWYDTSGANPVLRLRNAANTGWIQIADTNAPPITAAALAPYATTAAMTAADNLRVLKSGDTMTGALGVPSIAGLAGDANFSIGGSASYRTFRWSSAIFDGIDVIAKRRDLSIDGNAIVLIDANTFTVNAGTFYTKYGCDLGADVHARGGAYKPGGGPWGDSSDERIKDNIADYTHGLAEVLQLRPRTYTYKAETERDTSIMYTGLIAQECETAMPEMVKTAPGKVGTMEFDDLRTLDTTALIYALVNAVREVHDQVQALREQFGSQGRTP